jgi:hypothetical protein
VRASPSCQSCAVGGVAFVLSVSQLFFCSSFIVSFRFSRRWFTISTSRNGRRLLRTLGRDSQKHRPLAAPIGIPRYFVHTILSSSLALDALPNTAIFQSVSSEFRGELSVVMVARLTGSAHGQWIPARYSGRGRSTFLDDKHIYVVGCYVGAGAKLQKAHFLGCLESMDTSDSESSLVFRRFSRAINIYILLHPSKSLAAQVSSEESFQL